MEPPFWAVREAHANDLEHSLLSSGSTFLILLNFSWHHSDAHWWHQTLQRGKWNMMFSWLADQFTSLAKVIPQGSWEKYWLPACVRGIPFSLKKSISMDYWQMVVSEVPGSLANEFKSYILNRKFPFRGLDRWSTAVFTDLSAPTAQYFVVHPNSEPAEAVNTPRILYVLDTAVHSCSQCPRHNSTPVFPVF